MICLISFSKFSDLLPFFTCESAIGSICLAVTVLIPLPFCCLLKLRIYSAI